MFKIYIFLVTLAGVPVDTLASRMSFDTFEACEIERPVLVARFAEQVDERLKAMELKIEKSECLDKEPE